MKKKSQKIDKGKSVATQPLILPTGRPHESNTEAPANSTDSERHARYQRQNENFRSDNDAPEGDKPSDASISTSKIPVRSPARSDKLRRNDDAPEGDKPSDTSSNSNLRRKNPALQDVGRET